MAIRPPRKNTAARPRDAAVVRLEPVQAGAGAQDGEASRQAPDQAGSPADRLLRDLDAVLRNEPGIDDEVRQLLQGQFAEALETAEANSGAAASVPARADWLDAIEALRQSGLVGDNDVNELVRQIDTALAPLQRRESKLAVEFSRRIQEEGQERALAWFREASQALDGEGAADGAANPSGFAAMPASGSEVIHSRSRRLRGPPVRR